MFAKAGGTFNHASIVLNAASSLMEQLRGHPCEAAAVDIRLHSAKFFTYPDVVVLCGPSRFLDNRRDMLTDATLIVEVLSPSTKNYDRGDKFYFYRSLASFAEYLLISQDVLHVEHWRRNLDGSWLLREYKSPADEINLSAIGCRLRLKILYERVDFHWDSGSLGPDLADAQQSS